VAQKDLFVVNEQCKKLTQQEVFHCVVAKLIYLWKHGRPDIGNAVSFLTKLVREPDLDNWKKLDHLVTYLKADCTQK